LHDDRADDGINMYSMRWDEGRARLDINFSILISSITWRSYVTLEGCVRIFNEVLQFI